MRKEIFNKPKNFRMAIEAVEALDLLRLKIRSTGKVKFSGRVVSQESVLCSLLMWARDQDPNVMALQLKGYLKLLESFGSSPTVDEESA